MSTVAAGATTRVASDNAARPVTLDRVFEELDQQRRAALSNYWRTAIKSLVALPFSFLPGLPLAALVTDSAGSNVLSGLAGRLKSLTGDSLSLIVFVGVALIFVGLFFIARYFHANARGPVRAYERDYKRHVFSAVCAQHFPGLRYDVDGYIGYDEFEATGLFPYPVDEYFSEDYFEGQLGQTEVRFAEVTAARERRRLIGKPKRYMETYFDGIVLVADFHKHFHSITRLVPDGEKIDKVRGQRSVALEDPEFEALFSVVSTDQTDVRYVLSPSMMQRFVQLARRFPKLRARFENENLILLLPASRDHFETSVYQHPACPQQIDRFVQDLKSIVPVVEELDLNTRIWSKA